MRVVALLCVPFAFAQDDEYHHTQLLQTRVQHAKMHANVSQREHAGSKSKLRTVMAKLRSKGAKARFAKAFVNAEKKVVEKKQLQKRMLEDKPAFVSKNLALKHASKHPGAPQSPEDYAQSTCPYITDELDECMHCVDETTHRVCEEHLGLDATKFFECSQTDNFMDYLIHCLPQEGPGERACKQYYPDAVDQCLDCGEHCYFDLGCESLDQCFGTSEFHDCHYGCMSAPASTSTSSSSSWDPADDPYVQEQCAMFYGEGVDVGQCVECGYDCASQVPEEVWQSENPEDHMDAIETIMTCSDECMGKKNSFVVACQDQADHMGIELDLGQCLGCGMMCGCDANHCDEQCHNECMAFGHSDEDHHEDDEIHDEGAQMCKEFYGESVDVGQCMECAEGCYREASMYAAPEDFLVVLLGCSDSCMGQENEATQLCRKFGGFNDSGDVDDLRECFACGMECCESLGECKEGHKDECMNECIPHDSTDLIQTKKAVK